MLQKIADFARGTNQPPPSSPGEFVRCALESLALAYQEKLLALESILGQEFDVLHIVGGGGRNSLLCQMTADATGRRVVVGPYEATAMGNALVQAMGLGHVRDLWHLRHIVANSGGLCEYTPQHDSKWKIAAEKFAVLSGSK
jgi:rhamnulokinase